MPETIAQPPPILLRLRRVARFLDSEWRFPGTSFRFGADGIIGLVPGFGDVVSTVAALYVIYAGLRLGVPWRGLVRMGGNFVLDAVAGMIPFLGDLADIVYKSNLRNLAIVEAQHRPQAMRPAAAIFGVFMAIVMATFLMLFGLLLFLAHCFAVFLGSVSGSI